MRPTCASALLGLTPTWARGKALGMNNATKFWALNGVDGDLEILDEAMLTEFFGVNAETMIPDEMAIIRNLEPGVAFQDGGGASPTWSIRRMTVDEIAEGGF